MNPFGRRKTDQSPDQQAIARYRYLLKTAPPETIEQAHAEAFAQLTPEQRRLVLQQIAEQLPASERPLADQNALSPQTLARLATRRDAATGLDGTHVRSGRRCEPRRRDGRQLALQHRRRGDRKHDRPPVL